MIELFGFEEGFEVEFHIFFLRPSSMAIISKVEGCVKGTDLHHIYVTTTAAMKKLIMTIFVWVFDIHLASSPATFSARFHWPPCGCVGDTAWGFCACRPGGPSTRSFCNRFVRCCCRWSRLLWHRDSCPRLTGWGRGRERCHSASFQWRARVDKEIFCL